MLWQGRRESSNVDDRRGISGGQVAFGGGILGVIALVLNFLLGVIDVDDNVFRRRFTIVLIHRAAHDHFGTGFVKIRQRVHMGQPAKRDRTFKDRFTSFTRASNPFGLRRALLGTSRHRKDDLRCKKEGEFHIS